MHQSCIKHINMHKHKLFSPFLSIINKGVNNQNTTKSSPPFYYKETIINKGVNAKLNQYIFLPLFVRNNETTKGLIKIMFSPFLSKTKTKPNRGDNQLRYQLKICQWSILIPIEGKQRSINGICDIHSWRGRR